MTEERKYAILFAATILAARKLAEVGERPCPARDACISDAITKAELILRKIEQRWPSLAALDGSAGLKSRTIGYEGP
jgi:hypothetical protein